MPGMKKTDLAYTAGIVDGEGCISILPRNYQKQKTVHIRYILQVAVGSTDEWLPMWLKFAYGGHLHKIAPKKLSHNPAWYWQLTSNQAKVFLELILPYLHLKRDQATLAIQFQSRKRRWGFKGSPQHEKILDEADAIRLRKIHRGETTNDRENNNTEQK